MRTKEEIRERLAEVRGDKRLSYPPAQVEINAPLALIQVALKATASALAWALEEEEDEETTPEDERNGRPTYGDNGRLWYYVGA